MKRYNISGFQFTLFGYTLEIVTVYLLPCCIAIWRGSTFIARFER